MTRPLVKGETPAWKRLISPVKYLAIKHELKDRFDWWWPGVLTVATMALLWALPVRATVLGEAGLLDSIRDLIALLAAFYVVALAAVATFQQETLDKSMEGTTPKLYGKDLTRRQFVCYLFGYLAFLAFSLFLVIIVAQAVVPSANVLLDPDPLWWVTGVLGAVFAFFFWNMIVTTLLGIYFLVERVHLPSS